MSNQIHRVYTVALDRVESGARVDNYHLQGANVDIPAILVGEDGRGRQLGILPVAGANPGDTIMTASIGQTRAGRPKLVAAAPLPEDQEAPAILVLHTPIGFRGGNAHHGTKTGTQKRYDSFLMREFEESTYDPLPGEILVRGLIAQGDAGRMGNGEQLILAVSPGTEITIRLSGRLYGSPREYIVKYDGRRVISLPADEADLLD